MAITNTMIADLVGTEKSIQGATIAKTYRGNTFLNAGVLATSADMNTFAGATGPRTFGVPFLKPLVYADPNVASDDINVEGAVGKLTGDEYGAVKHILNYAVSDTDLTRMVTGVSIENVSGLFARYWNDVQKAYTINVLKGVLAVGGAAFTTDTSAATDGTQIFGVNSLPDAQAQMGENGQHLQCLVVHPMVYAKMQKDQANAFVPKNLTNLDFDTYAGYKVVISKDMPNAAGVYTSALLGSGFLAYGEGAPLSPVEIERKANGGNGEGGTILHSRKNLIIHPQGFGWKGVVAPTAAALAVGTNWQLKADREDVAVAFIKTKVA
jgi:hypothetical protein